MRMKQSAQSGQGKSNQQIKNRFEYHRQASSFKVPKLTLVKGEHTVACYLYTEQVSQIVGEP